MCNFGPEDKSEIVPQVNANAIKIYLRENEEEGNVEKKSPKYDAFLVNKAVRQMAKCIGQDFC